MGLVYPGAAPEAAKEGNASPSLNLAQRSGLRVGDVSAFTDTAPKRRALPRAVRAKAKRPARPGNGPRGRVCLPHAEAQRVSFPVCEAPSALVLDANFHVSECRLDFRLPRANPAHGRPARVV